MRSRPSLLSKFWRKLRGSERPKPVARVRESKVMPSLEPLEGRIAPATIINATTVLFQDVDGDVVTVKFSKPLFDLATDTAKLAAANAVLKFSTGTVDTVAKTFTPANPGQQLQLIDLTAARTGTNGVSVAIGTTITVSVAKSTSGDGFTNVGYIHAYEPATSTVAAKQVPLGAVKIAGDLGQIDAGGLDTKVGLASLTVKSLGVADPATTQPAVVATTLPSSRTLVSNIIGALGPVTVTDDMKGTIKAQNGNSVFGTIGNVTIGGSLSGGSTEDSGSIISDTNIGAVKIGTALNEGIFGGTGKNSGTIRAGGGFPGKITSVTISGSITSATSAGVGSAAISAKTSIGAVKIGGNIDGTLSGAAGMSSAGIASQGTITSVTVNGFLKGGDGTLTGFITSGADLGAVKVGSILGGGGANSASINAGGKLASLTVVTDVVAGAGSGSASIASGTDFDLIGDMGAIKIGGKLQGGGTQNSGSISSGGKIASVTIGPAAAVDQVLLAGGGGAFSGSIFSLGAMGAVKITGNVEGGGGAFSGSIVSRDYITSDVEKAGTLGAVTIVGHLKGGVGNDSGEISADGKIASVTIGKVGAVSDSLVAGSGLRSGSIRAGQGVVEPGVTGAIKINGNLSGVSGGAQAGAVISEGKLTGVSVTGSVNGGTISSGDDLGSLSVGGNLTDAKISARGVAVQGATSDLAIGKITVKGNVSTTSIRAGYDTQLNAVNPDAQIGAVAVTGSWTASDLIAGVIDSGAAGFGIGDTVSAGFDNAKIVSQIASIVIGGAVTGTPAVAGDHFGFVAQKIGSLKIAGVAVALTTGVDSIDLPAGDVTALEIATVV